MDKSKEEFVVWIRQAMGDKNSIAYQELYQFLTRCFIRADKSFSGLVSKYNFDTLVEEAAALPRKYGYAPKSEDMFPSDEARKRAREALFDTIDTDKSGTITLEEWIKYAVNHIMGKVKNLPKDILGPSSTASKTEFISFLQRASDKSSPEYKDLYFFLLQAFISGDTAHKGEIDAATFDRLIEVAAAAPRRHGLAPKTTAMFKTDAVSCHWKLGYLRKKMYLYIFKIFRSVSRRGRNTLLPWIRTTVVPSPLMSG